MKPTYTAYVRYVDYSDYSDYSRDDYVSPSAVTGVIGVYTVTSLQSKRAGKGSNRVCPPKNQCTSDVGQARYLDLMPGIEAGQRRRSHSPSHGRCGRSGTSYRVIAAGQPQSHPPPHAQLPSGPRTRFSPKRTEHAAALAAAHNKASETTCDHGAA